MIDLLTSTGGWIAAVMLCSPRFLESRGSGILPIVCGALLVLGGLLRSIDGDPWASSAMVLAGAGTILFALGARLQPAPAEAIDELKVRYFSLRLKFFAWMMNCVVLLSCLFLVKGPWFGVVAFPLSLWLLVRLVSAAVREEVVVTIGARGLLDSRTGETWIPWSAIDSICVLSNDVIVELVEPIVVAGRSRGLLGWLAKKEIERGGPLGLRVQFLEIDPYEFAEHFERLRRLHTASDGETPPLEKGARR